MTMLKFKEKKEISDSMMMDYSRRYRADGFKPARGRGKKKNLLCGFIQQQQRCLS
jgi:hypothetical protein